MARRYYSNTFVATTLAGGITALDTTITVTAVSGAPSMFPYTGVIGRGTASEELVEVTAAAGTSLTVVRGIDGTSAKVHTIGSAFEHVLSARDLDEPNAHINAATDVHPQYLLETGGTISGALAVTGNATVGGTLGVTGATTLTGLTAGATTLGATTTGALTAASAAVTADADLNGSVTVGDAAIVGQLTAQSKLVGTKTAVFRAMAAQTANILDAQDSAGTSLVVVNSAGKISAGAGIDVSGPLGGVAGGAGIAISSLNATDEGLVIRPAVGATANSIECRDSSNVNKTVIGPTGNVGIQSSAPATTSLVVNSDVNGIAALFQATNAADRPLVLRAAASQTGNLLQCNNSSSSQIMAIGPTGAIDSDVDVSVAGSSLPRGELYNGVRSATVSATNTTPVNIPLTPASFVVPGTGNRDVMVVVDVTTCTGNTGNETGRVTLAGVTGTTYRSQWVNSKAGAAGEVSLCFTSVHTIVGGATISPTLSVLKVDGGTQVNVATIRVSVVDLGGA